MIGIVVGLPLSINWYDKYQIMKAHPDIDRVILLTAKVSKGACLWTLDDVNGFNYWYKKFKFANEIHVKEGEKVLFRVRSADVTHSFAIPQYNIGPLEVPSGSIRNVEFTAAKKGKFIYLCWLWCSECHGDLKGRIVVE